MKTFNYKILKVMAFSVIILFMSSAVFAQVQESQQDTTAQDTTTQMNNQQQTMPQEQNQQMGDDMQSQHPDEGVDYSKNIEQKELPQEVTSSLDELYPAHKVQEAYRGDDDSYKVKVKNETDEAVVYYDSEGKFLRAENLSGLNQEGSLPQEQGQRTMDSQDQDQWGTDDQQKRQGTQQDTVGNQQDMQTGDQQGTQQQQWETEDTEMQEEDRVSPQEQNQRTGDEMRSQDADQGVDYSETIQKEELPQEVNSSLDELYPAHEIQEVSKGDDDSFKVTVKNEDDEAVVYYDSEGQFLRAKNLSGLDQQGTMPQEQGQRTMDDTQSQQGTQSNQWESDTTDTQNQQEQWGTEGTEDADTSGYQADPQEMNQRIEDVEESQDADRWGTDNRTPGYESDTTSTGTQQDEWENQSDTLNNDGSAYPQEQNQQIEGSQDEEKFEDNWGSEDMGAHQSTWKDGEGYPQEQNQQTEDDAELNDQEDQSTWMGGEGADTTMTPSRIDTTAVYKNQWEEGTLEEDNESASPQEQEQETTEWGETDTTDVQNEYDTTPADTSGMHNDQMMNDNELDNDDAAFPQEQNQQSSEWGSTDTTDVQEDYGTTPADTSGMYNDQMMENNELDNDDSAFPQEQNQQSNDWGSKDTTDVQDGYETSPADTTGSYNDQMMEDNTLDETADPQEQYQTTGEDVEYNEEIQENELPETVTSSLDELYPDHEIEKVFRGEDDSYKIVVKNNDDKVAVFYDSDGLFYRDENMNNMLEDNTKDTNQDW